MAVDPADARRIVAVVNAVAGISTKILERGAIREFLEACAGADDIDIRTASLWLATVRARPARARRRPEDRARRSDAVRAILEAVALAGETDLRAIQKWLRATRSKH
jgi:hypothetical protein